MSCYKEYTTKEERKAINALIAVILARGYTISVYDGEEFTVKRSNNAKQIKDALATTDHDMLKVRDADGNVIGWFCLIYDNSIELMEVIADYSANPESDSIYAEVEKLLG